MAAVVFVWNERAQVYGVVQGLKVAPILVTQMSGLMYSADMDDRNGQSS